MRLVVILALLLPVNLSADSYWQRFKNYIAYYLLGRQTTPPAAVATDELGQPIAHQPPTPATIAVPPPSSPIPLTKQFRRPITTSPAITTYRGTLGDPYRTTSSPTKPTKKPAPPTLTPPVLAPSNIMQVLDSITTVKMGDVIQVQCAHQGANANCGYNALKNALALGNASYTQDPAQLAMLQETINPQTPEFSNWFKTIKEYRFEKYKQSDSYDWLDQTEIYLLIQKFPPKYPYTITVIDDVDRLITGEGIVDETMDGFIKAQKNLQKINDNYVQPFVIGSMNEFQNRENGHWFTVVLCIANRKIQYVMTDSLDNESLPRRYRDINKFIEILNTKDFRIFKLLHDIRRNIEQLKITKRLLDKKIYVQHDSAGLAEQKGLVVIDWDLGDVINQTLENINVIYGKVREDYFIKTEKFQEIANDVEHVLKQLLVADRNGDNLTIIYDTNNMDFTFSIEIKLDPSVRRKINGVLEYLRKEPPPKKS